MTIRGPGGEGAPGEEGASAVGDAFHQISRMLAAKAALVTRLDALGEGEEFDLGAKHKISIQNRIRILEQGRMRHISKPISKKFEKHFVKSVVMQYNVSNDFTLPIKRRFEIEQFSEGGAEESQEKKKTKIKQEVEEEPEEYVSQDVSIEEKKKKKKKSLVAEIELGHGEIEEESATPVSEKKKKKKRKSEVME